MSRITFADPLFLYLLAVVPAMIAFYILKQHKSTASLRMPGLQPFCRNRKNLQALSETYTVRSADCRCNPPDNCPCPSAGNK